jgi:hypothetical protein
MSQTTEQPQVTTLGEALDPDRAEQAADQTRPVPVADEAAVEETQPIATVELLKDDDEAAEPEAEPEPEEEQPALAPTEAAPPAQAAAPELSPPAQAVAAAATRAMDTHAAEVLARIVASDAPTPDAITLNARKWPGPYLSAMYHEDADQSRLQAAREIYGGEVLRNDDRHKEHGGVYFELRVDVDGVEVRFWTLVDAAQIPAAA